MGVGDTWAGTYLYTEIVPGTWTVLPWAACVVLIRNVNVTGLFYCETTRNINFGAGRCSIKAADPNRTQYLLFQEGDEIEVYMAVGTTANKVWGGYIETISLDNSAGELLTINGSEYSVRLINQKFTDTFVATELSTAVEDIMTNQTDFASAVEATTSKNVDGIFADETIYNALQKFLDQWGYCFWVDTDKIFYTALKSTVSMSPDYITAGDNVTKVRSEMSTKEYLCNDVTVKGSGSFTATAEDTDSQTTYGIHSKQLTVASLNSAATVQQFATQYIADNKDPKPTQRFRTRLLMFTDPREYITIDLPSLDLSGNYQVAEITHKWGLGEGLLSEVEITNPTVVMTRQLGTFERRIRDVENETF